MQKNNIKIIFFGTADFAIPALEALVKAGYDIVAMITQPDKSVGRKQVLTPPPIKLVAQDLKLKILQPEKLRSNPEFIGELKNLQPDIGILGAYGKLIPPEIFNLPKYGILVLHPSLLPRYRGPSPVQSAILNGDKETGITIMKMDEGIDHGDIISSENYQIPETASFKEINNAIWHLGANLLIKKLPDYLTGKIKPIPQDHSQATFCQLLKSEDGEIKPSDSPLTAHNKIRALNPEPGTYIWFEENNRKKRLKIMDAELNNDHLELKLVQLEGGKAMSAKEFTIGHPNFNKNLL